MKIKAPAFQIGCAIALSSLSLLVGLGRADTPASPALPADLAGFRLGASEEVQQQQRQQASTPDAVPPGKPLPWYDDLINHRVPIQFGVKVSETYSDNIFYQPKKTGDFITAVAPFVAFHLGHAFAMEPQLDQETVDSKDSGDLNYFSIDYHPTFRVYADNSDLDVVDQHAHAAYAHRFGKLTLSLEQIYDKLSEPTIQDNAAGSLVLRDIYTTTAKASYAYSDKLSIYGSANQVWTEYQSNLYTSNTEWNAEAYFLYQLFPKMSVGLGPRIGFVDIDRAANQEYQSALVHIFYPATGKLSFVLAGGAEVREFEHDVVADKVTPIVEAQAIYRPFDSMTVSLDAGRHSIVSSSQIGSNYDASTVAVLVRQRLLQVIYFHVTAGFEDDSYSAAGGGGTTRDDSIYFVNTGIEWSSKDWLVIDGSYQYTRDDSSVDIFKFDENRFTASATLKY